MNAHDIVSCEAGQRSFNIGTSRGMQLLNARVLKSLRRQGSGVMREENGEPVFWRGSRAEPVCCRFGPFAILGTACFVLGRFRPALPKLELSLSGLYLINQIQFIHEGD